MPETTTMRCQSCGQGWQLHQTDVFNTNAATYCPICGTPTLERDSTALGINAKCFAFANSKLVELLYATWSLNLDKSTTAPRDQHKRFIDFLHEQLSAD